MTPETVTESGCSQPGESIRQRIDRVRARIDAAAGRSGRDPERIRLVAVSKTVAADRVREAAEAGLREFGENRVQEAKGKIANLPSGLSWHMVGSLQRNKARLAGKLFHMVQSVDRLSLAELLADAARPETVPLAILIQVNIAGEPQKSGVTPPDLPELLRNLSRLEGVRVEGLMAIPPYLPEPEASRPHFRALRCLAEEIDRLAIPGISMKVLSMGMSADFEVAIEEGATLIRLGTAIFGARPGR